MKVKPMNIIFNRCAMALFIVFMLQACTALEKIKTPIDYLGLSFALITKLNNEVLNQYSANLLTREESLRYQARINSAHDDIKVVAAILAADPTATTKAAELVHTLHLAIQTELEKRQST